MSFGWKVLIPAGLLWILITGASIVLPERYRAVWRAATVIAGPRVLVLLMVGPLFTSPPRASSRSGAAR